MGAVGGGIFLVVLGLVQMFALQVDVPGLDDGALGVILIVAGIAAIALGLFKANQENKFEHKSTKIVSKHED